MNTVRTFSTWLLLLVLRRQFASAAPAPNDNCSGATSIASLPYEDDDTTAEATTDLNDALCLVEAGAKGNWYTFVGTGRLTEIRYTTGFQYKHFALYKGNDCEDDLLCVLHQRASGIGATATRLLVSEYNQTYYLLLTGYNSGSAVTSHTGGYALDLQDFAPPSNDECVGATAISAFPYADDGTTFAALPDGADTLCGVEQDQRGVWYSFVGTGKATEIRYQTGFFYKHLAVYHGTDCGNLVCEGNVRGTGYGTTIEYRFVPELGETYQLLLTSYSSNNPSHTNGNYGLDIEVHEPPANDECDDATAITTLPFQEDGDTTDALFDLEDTLCNVEPGARGVWYSIVGTGNWLELSYQAGFFYKHMAVYKGSCGDGLLCVANKRLTGHDTTAVLSIVLEANVTYHILLTGYSTAAANLVSGNYGFSVEEKEPPSHDECASAMPVRALPYEDNGNTMYAHEDPEDSICNVEATARGVWYSFMSNGGWTEIQFTTGFYYKHMALYHGSECDGLTCEVNQRCTGYDTTCELSAVLEANETYQLLLTGYSTSAAHMVAGNYALKIEKQESPPNNECGNSTFISELPYNRDGSTKRATFEEFQDSLCGVDPGARGVWYSLIGTGNNTKFRYTTAFLYKNIAIYKGSCDGGLNCVASKRLTGYGSTVEILLPLEAGVTYHIFLSGYGTAAASLVAGDYSLSVEDFDGPSNDDCENAVAIEALPFEESGDTTHALIDFEDSLCNVDATSRGVWYSFQSNGGWTQFLYSTGFFYKHMALYKGECESLTCEANKRCTGYDTTCEMDVVLEEGETYHLLLTGYGTAVASQVSGSYVIDIAELPPPANDLCENAIAAPGLPYDHDGNTATATTDLEDTTCNVESGSRGVWYSIVGTGKWTDILYTTGFTYKHMALYKGSSCDDLNCVTYKTRSGQDTTAEMSLILDANQTYHLLLTGYTASAASLVSGSYGLDVIDHDRPPNDRCMGAFEVASFPYEDDGDTTSALPDFEDILCGVESAARGVWYELVGDGFAVTVEYASTFFYKHISVYRGVCGDLVCDNYERRTGTSVVQKYTWDTQVGVVYYVFLSGYNTASNTNNYGQYQLDITSSAPTPMPSVAPTVKNPVASGLYGTSGYNASAGHVSDLYSIDAYTGVSAFIGTVFVRAIGVNEPVLLDGLSYDPVADRMLGHTSVDSPYAASSLVSINFETAQATVIGSATSVNTYGLAVQATGGVAYSWSEDGALVVLSTHTGQAVILGPPHVATIGNHSFGFDDGDVLHLLNDEGGDHYMVSTITGEATLAGLFEPLIGSMNGDVQPHTGLFYGPSTGGTGLIQIYDLDTSGLQSNVLPTGIVGLHTLAFVEGEAAIIATPSPHERITQAPQSTSPTPNPTPQPSSGPSSQPSADPSSEPSPGPSTQPSDAPTLGELLECDCVCPEHPEH